MFTSIDDSIEYLTSNPDVESEESTLCFDPEENSAPPPLPPPPPYVAGPTTASPSESASYQQEMDNLAVLVSMGYDSATAFVALKSNGFNIERSIEYLTNIDLKKGQESNSKAGEEAAGSGEGQLVGAPSQQSRPLSSAALPLNHNFPKADFSAGKRYGHEDKFIFTFTSPQLGLQLVASRGDYRKNGSHVSKVIEGSEASRLGVRVGDIIIGFILNDPECKGLKRCRVCKDHADTAHFLLESSRPLCIQMARPTIQFPSRGWQSVPEYLPFTPMYSMGLRDYTNTCTVQLLRSVGQWSLGVETENSIYRAMLHAIKTSSYYIYIENQFFCTSVGTVKNQIGAEIKKRIVSAMKAKQKFRVTILLPLHPEGVVQDSPTKAVMHWQYSSIGRQGRGLLVDLKTVADREGVQLKDYIGFYSLRKAGFLNGRVVAEQIYPHVKLMIVDDRTVIVGTANINDRSLLGDRDSEIALFVQDSEKVKYFSTINGAMVKVCGFAHSLRQHIWAEHLGLKAEGEAGIAKVLDPLSDEVCVDIWQKTADYNTKVFEHAVDGQSWDSCKTMSDFNKMLSAISSHKRGSF